MTFLITNDDGIESEGLLTLVQWAVTKGDVIVVAPKLQQSAKSQSISIKNPFEITETEYPVKEVKKAYSVDSSPADCIRAAFDYLKLEADFVFSGINRGYNIGREIAYSGTDGAVFEACYHNVNSVAWSTKNGYMETAAQHLDRIWDFIIGNRLFAYHNLYNVNIPIIPGDIVLTTQGGTYRADRFEELGNNIIVNKRTAVEKSNERIDNDVDAILNNRISITPLSLQRTDYPVLEKLQSLGI